MSLANASFHYQTVQPDSSQEQQQQQQKQQQQQQPLDDNADLQKAVEEEQRIRNELESVEQRLGSFDQDLRQLRDQNRSFYTDLSGLLDSEPEWNAERQQQLADRVQRFVCSGKSAALSRTDARDVADRLSLLMDELRKQKEGNAAASERKIAELQGELRRHIDTISNLKGQLEQSGVQLKSTEKDKEAAIKKQEDAKRESQHMATQLEAANGHVRTVDEINGKMKDQIENLVKQDKKASEHIQELQIQLNRETQAHINLQEKLAAETERVKGLEKLNSTLKEELESVKRERELAEVKFEKDVKDHKERQRHEFDKEKNHLVIEIERLKSDLTACHDKAVSAHDDAKRIYETQLNAEKEKVSSLTSQLSNVKMEAHKTLSEAQVNSAAAAAKDREIEQLKARMQTAAKTHAEEDLKKQIEDLREQIARKDKENAVLKQTQSERRADAVADADAKDKEIAILREQLKNTTANEHQAEIAQKLASKELELLKVQEAKESSHSSAAELAEKEKQIEVLKTKHEAAEKEIDELKTKHAAAEKKIQKMNTALLQVQAILMEQKKAAAAATAAAATAKAAIK